MHEAPAKAKHERQMDKVIPKWYFASQETRNSDDPEFHYGDIKSKRVDQQTAERL